MVLYNSRGSRTANCIMDKLSIALNYLCAARNGNEKWNSIPAAKVYRRRLWGRCGRRWTMCWRPWPEEDKRLRLNFRYVCIRRAQPSPSNPFKIKPLTKIPARKKDTFCRLLMLRLGELGPYFPFSGRRTGCKRILWLAFVALSSIAADCLHVTFRICSSDVTRVVLVFTCVLISRTSCLTKILAYFPVNYFSQIFFRTRVSFYRKKLMYVSVW